MHKLGYIERLPIALKALADAESVQRLLDEKGMTAYTFLSGKRDRLDIDVLAGKSLRFQEYDKRRVMVDIEGGLSVPVIAVDDLLEMKQEAQRPNDLRDIEALLELKGL